MCKRGRTVEGCMREVRCLFYGVHAIANCSVAMRHLVLMCVSIRDDLVVFWRTFASGQVRVPYYYRKLVK